MTDEREMSRGLLSKDAGFRLIVNGQIGPKEIDTLIKKLEIDKLLLQEVSKSMATEYEDDEGGRTAEERDQKRYDE